MPSQIKNVGSFVKLMLRWAVKYLKLAILFSVLTAAGVLMGEKSFTEKHKLDEKRLLLHKENETLALDIKVLERKVTLLRSDAKTIEKVAKRKLGMAKPGETVYLFDEGRARMAHNTRESSLTNHSNLP